MGGNKKAAIKRKEKKEERERHKTRYDTNFKMLGPFRKTLFSSLGNFYLTLYLVFLMSTKLYIKTQN